MVMIVYTTHGRMEYQMISENINISLLALIIYGCVLLPRWHSVSDEIGNKECIYICMVVITDYALRLWWHGVPNDFGNKESNLIGIVMIM